MRILNVYPKDWHTQLELSLTQVNKLLDFLDNCEFQGDDKDPKMQDAFQYVTKEFFPQLNQLTEDLKKGEIDGT